MVAEVSEQTRSRPVSILVVDDDAMVLQVMAAGLRQSGYAVTTTTSPLDGLRILRENVCRPGDQRCLHARDGWPHARRDRERHLPRAAHRHAYRLRHRRPDARRTTPGARATSSRSRFACVIFRLSSSATWNASVWRRTASRSGAAGSSSRRSPVAHRGGCQGALHGPALPPRCRYLAPDRCRPAAAGGRDARPRAGCVDARCGENRDS